MLTFPLSLASREFQPMSPILSPFASSPSAWVLPKVLLVLNFPPASQEVLGEWRGTPRQRQKGIKTAGATPLSTESLTLLTSPLAISGCQSSGRHLSCPSFGGRWSQLWAAPGLWFCLLDAWYPGHMSDRLPCFPTVPSLCFLLFLYSLEGIWENPGFSAPPFQICFGAQAKVVLLWLPGKGSWDKRWYYRKQTDEKADIYTRICIHIFYMHSILYLYPRVTEE